MSGKLIMPKQTGQKDAFYASLELLYNSYKNGEKWYSNEKFKVEIQKLLPYLSKGAQDGPYLVKQSELVRYFGLAEYDYSSKPGKSHITDTGIRFYNAYLQNNDKLQLDIIMQSILNNSFGRNNTAIQSSDSDIDPPKLFLKAIVDLNGITGRGLAYLLYVTHDLNITYNDAIIELSKSDNRDREIPIEVSNKYNDVKFTVLLNALGIVEKNGDVYSLSQYTSENYLEQIKKLSIYNKEPELVLTLREEYDEDTEELLDEPFFTDIDQNKVIGSYAYDITSEKFKSQNNRIPKPIKVGKTFRYKTNPRISKTALDLANHICLGNHEHVTFVSKLGKPYMEAHHLIPMMAQKDFSINLDRIENIVSICPICHSAIHLGDDATRLELVKKLFDIKEKELKSVGLNISFGELFSKYYK